MTFTIYSKPACSSCEQAKALLTERGFAYTELILDTGQVKDPAKTYTTVETLKAIVPTARTVPQIFRDGQLIGGFDALRKLL